MSTPSNKELLNFILTRFNETELRLFNVSYFPDVENHLSSGMSKNDKVLELIGYCQRHGMLENLLVALEQERTSLFQKAFPKQQTVSVTTPVFEVESRIRNPNQIFISHSSQDAEIAQKVAKDLQGHGFDIFITPNSIRPGEQWVPAIGRGLDESAVFLILLTPNSLNSKWVRKEANTAIALDNEDEARLLFLQVEECKPPSLWRQWQFLSFRNRSYKENFASLLRELKGEVEPPQLKKPRIKPAEPLPATKQVDTEDAEITALYKQLMHAVAVKEWLNVIILAAQIEEKQPSYKDVTVLRTVALQQLQNTTAKPNAPLKTETVATPPAKAVSTLAQCEATTKSGKRCRKRAVAGGNFCTVHKLKPQSSAVKQPLTTVQKTESKPKRTRQQKTDKNSFIHEKTGLEFVRISAGDFIYCNVKTKKAVEKSKGLFRGKETVYEDAYEEGKMHLPEYWISKTAVTHAVYKQFIDANPNHEVPIRDDDDVDRPYNWNKQKRMFPTDKAEHPVVFVTWHDAIAFCKWAGLQLPTEEQWEKAARGTDGRKYPWGNNDPTDKHCNFNKNVGSTTAVGHYSPRGDSPFGCVDMSGNVWEWCLNKHKTPEDTAVDQSGDVRVLRGGSWDSGSFNMRTSSRNNGLNPFALYNCGFRVVLVRPPS